MFAAASIAKLLATVGRCSLCFIHTYVRETWEKTTDLLNQYNKCCCCVVGPSTAVPCWFLKDGIIFYKKNYPRQLNYINEYYYYENRIITVIQLMSDVAFVEVTHPLCAINAS